MRPSSVVRRSPKLARPAVSCLALLVAFGGCAYRFGQQSLYPCDVRTIHVAMFDSISLRRGLGERLTEAVVREIELKTPFKIVDATSADSVLSGRIVNDAKGVLLYAPTAEARNLQIDERVEVSWVDRRGASLQAAQTVPIPAALATIDQSQNFIPEAGQTITTAQQKAIERLAEQIVSLLEAPW